MDPSPESEVLHEGWMVKSPPLETKSKPSYSLFKARWRRRWFVLQQGKLPRQYLLNYYTDETKKRHKGTICLDECEQVDIGLEDGNGKYDFMFNIKTPGRIYFLAVDTREEMDKWVGMVCNACGLRAEYEENATSAKKTLAGPIYANTAELAQPSMTSSSAPAVVVKQQPKSISSPYIHISDCYSGKAPPPVPPQRIKSDSQSSQRHNSSTDEEQIYFYMPPVNTTSSTMGRNGKNSVIMIPANSYEHQSIAYIDLDLPKSSDDDVFGSSTGNNFPRPPPDDSATIYKTVDFAKTEAFNRTKREIENKRQQK